MARRGGQCLWVLLLLTAALAITTVTEAFAPAATVMGQRMTVPWRTTDRPTSALSSSSSSLPDKQSRFELPPPPEDTLTLAGDIMALFLYSFLDHKAHDELIDIITNDGVSKAVTELDPFNEYSITTQIPVWFDTVHSLTQQDQLLVRLSMEHVGYAPILSSIGMASFVLSTAWLLSGSLNRAFSYSNTLNCDTQRMLFVTGKTWLLSTTMVVLVAMLSAQNSCHCVTQTMPTTLTKPDADFIFDSLTVLITWRFTISMLMGGSTKK